MKIMSVVGARPNFMKVAPIISAILEHNDRVRDGKVLERAEVIEHTLIHTGQHYDKAMSDSFFSDLNLPVPDVHLGVGSGSHAEQTAEIMRKFEVVLYDKRPDILVVVGDVNSTVACALVAAKISFDSAGKRPLIAHVEAGLRSGDRTMPEELNRVLTDQLSDLLFITEESGIENLSREGINPGQVHFVGNTMIDSLLACKGRAATSGVLEDLVIQAQQYVLLTLHRPGNVDRRDTFVDILEGIRELASAKTIIFPAHPRTKKKIVELGLEHYFDLNYEDGDRKNSSKPGLVRLVGPLGYIDFVSLMMNASMVVTDSGGIQEETTCLQVPCVTVRENTERPVTISHGTNVLAGVKREGIRLAISHQLGVRPSGIVPEKWDGKSAHRIIQILHNSFLEQSSPWFDKAVAADLIEESQAKVTTAC
jgi:UDP-N-acetylglucosamine 2-epimerase (non-hydrolysing)